MKNLNIQCKALATVNFVSEYEQMKPHESVRWAECRNTGQPGPGSTQQHFTCIRMENKLYQRHHTLSTVKNFAPKKRISQVSWTFNCKSMNYVVDILRKQLLAFISVLWPGRLSLYEPKRIYNHGSVSKWHYWWLMPTGYSVACRSAATPWTQIIAAVTLIIMKTLAPSSAISRAQHKIQMNTSFFGVD